ncbi:Short-chain dehydrogenase/reductase SDR [Fusarium oxysporum f. sp. vasinfectum]|nr:Short-chain dehydrogenase/reductase SDR [Fusarium oxysporum f. sp. vasinfectum]
MASSKAVVLITGANQGIGYSIALQLAASGKYHVLVGARSLSKAEAAIRELQAEGIDKINLTPIVLDVIDDSSVTAAVMAVSTQFGHLDILINNAGAGRIFCRHPVTDAFLPLIQASSYTDRRIVNVSSGVGLITMANEEGFEYNAQAYYVPDYRSSKAAVNMITVAQSVNFAKHDIAVVAAAPGMCRTRFTGGYGAKDPREGAAAIVRAATEGDPKKLTGTFVADEPHTGW